MMQNYNSSAGQSGYSDYGKGLRSKFYNNGVKGTQLKLRFVFSLIAVLFFAAASAQVGVTASGGTTTGSYATVNAAFTAINGGTHQGAIVITVTGSTTEPTTAVPLVRSGSGSANYTSLKITASGNAVINSGASPTASRGVLEFNGADNVTIDGDDPLTAGVQNLSIVVATNTATGTAAIRLASTSTTGTDGADNITIKNCIITGGRSSATSTTTSYGIVMSASTSITTGAYSSINTVIDNNIITRAYHGVYAAGSSTTYPNTGLQIKNNVFGSSTAANNIGARCVYISYTSTTSTGAAIIDGNDMRAGDVTATGSGIGGNVAAIELASGNMGTVISKNNIHDVMNPSTGGWAAHGIYFTSATGTGNTEIYNNFIRDMVGYKFSTTASNMIYHAHGIYTAVAVTGLKINHNTIALRVASSAGSTANTPSSSITINSSTAVVAELYNNIILNNNTSTAAYGVYTAANSNITLANNNNYYVPNGNIGYYNAGARATLAAWKTATSKDGASLNVNPPFASATDLHIPAGTVTTLESGGASTATTGITTDYDGNARPGPAGSTHGGGTVPDIGADEFDGIGDPCPQLPSSLASSSVAALTATISWSAATPAAGSGYEYYYSTSATTPTSGTTPSSSTAAGVTTANLTSLSANTPYYFWVRSNCDGTNKSAWVGPGTFTTLCSAQDVPYAEDFESVTVPAMPACSTVENVGTGNNWITASPAANGFTSKVLRYSYNSTNAANAWWYSKGLNLTGGTTYIINYKYGTNSTAYTESFKIAYGTGAVSTAMTNNIVNHASVVGNTPQTTYAVFTPASSGTYYIGFNVYSIANQNALFVDDITVDVAPACLTPLAPTGTAHATNITANISWTAAAGTVTGYEYAVTTSATAPVGAGTAVGNVTSVSNVSGLSPNTTYYVHVRTNCGGGTYSGWVTSTATFTTVQVMAINSGNFTDGANWNNGTGPVCGSFAFIPSGITLTHSSGTTTTAGIIINNGGTLVVSGGTLTVGCTGNNTTLSNSGTLTVSGGTLVVNGNISNASGSTFNQSAGDIIIDGNDNFATGTSVASGTPMLGFGTSTTSFSTGSINMTGGAITFVDPHVATTAGSGYTIYAYLASGVNFDAAAAHTIKFGNGVSTQQGGNTNGFYYNLYASTGRLNLGSVVINNPSGTNRNFTQYLYSGVMNGDLTVTAGTYSQNAFQTNIGGNLTVANGATYLATGSTYFCKSTGTGTTSAQTTAQSVSVSGTGSIQNLTSSPTANFTSLYIYNTSATGLTINPLNQVVANADVAASVSGTLTFNGKASTTSGKALLWGTAAAQGTTLTITSGGMMPGSAFARGWTSGQTGSAIGTTGVTPTSTTSQFPLIDANGNARYAWIERTGPSAAGILAITYTDGTGTDDVSHTDGSYTVDKRSKGKWTVSRLGTAIASTSYELAISAPSIFGATPASAEARLLTASGFVGIYQLGNNTPHAQRVLTDAQLTGGDFYMGINGNDLPFFSVQNGNWEDGTTWNKGVAPTSTDSVTISANTTVTAHTAAAVNAITVNTGGVLEVTSNTLAVTNTITNNGTVNVAGGTLNVTSTATNGVTNAGTFTLGSGTVNIGITDNTFANRRFTNTGTLTVSGGTMNIYGNLVHSGTAFNQSGGNINIDGNANGTAANSVLAATYHLHITVPTTNWTGGTITIVDPHNVDAAYVFYYSTTNIATDITTGTHTFRLGDGVSATAGGTNGFNIYTWGSARFTFRNFEVNGGSATGRFIRTAYGFGINGNLTINAASEFRDSAVTMYIGGNVVNNGTYTSTGTLYLGTYVAGTIGASTAVQSIGGTGTYKNSLTTSTANFTSLTVNNSNTGGVTLNIPLSLSGTLTLTAGKVNTTNTNLLTLGTATTAGTLSGGSVTAYIDGPFARTFAASKTSAAFGVANLFPVGKGTSYLPVNVDPVTTSGGAVVIKGEAFTSNSGTQGAGVSSVSTKRWEALVTSGGANLTNAMVRLGDADIQNSDKILIASSADGEYHGIASAITFASGTPNTLSTVSAIDAADYTGYLSHGVLNACAAPANQPTALTLISKTTTTATGSFTAAASAPSHYLVVAQPAANTPVAPVDFVTPTAASLGTGAIILYSGTATTFNGSGLTANTAYNIYVYSYNNSGCYGPVFNTASPLTYNFTTCASNATSPGTVTTSAITNSSYTATWTGPVGASYILEVATNTTFTNYVTGYNNVNIGAVTTTSITGLSQNTTYYTRVRTLVDGCSSTNTGYTTVTTQMLVPAPHTEGFTTTVVPAGWSAPSASVGSVRGITGNPGSSIYMNLYDDGDLDYVTTGNFTTVNVGMMPANYQLTFDYKLANYSSPYASPAAGSANFIVAVSTNYGSSYTNIETTVNDGTAGWKEKIYDLSAYAGLPVKIRITGNYISSSYIDFDLAFDNFKFAPIPACSRITTINVTNITNATATLGWVPSTNGTPVSYSYEVRTSGAPGSGATGLITQGTISAPTLTANVSTLTQLTTYTVYMRTLCTGSEYSEWTSGVQFTTVCDPVTTLPWAENFDGMSSIGTGVLPSCWLGANFVSATAAGNTYNDPRSAVNYVTIYYPTIERYLWTKGFQLTAGKSYDFTYYYAGDGFAGWNSEVYQNTTQSTTGITQVGSAVIVGTTTTVSTYTKVTRTFVPSSTGIYYFAIRTYASTGAPYYLGFDDFSLQETPPAISSFTPAATCSLAGETITVTGTHFAGITAVRFNGVNAQSFNVVNATTITAVAPQGVTTGVITIVGNAGTATSADVLTVTVTPVVADITGGNVTLCSGGTAALVSSTSAGTAVWSSSDEAVAHVDINTGVVTATGAGTATITYTAANGSCTAFKTTNITVNDAISITSFTNAQTVTPASDTYFSVVATGTGLTYQWYVSTNGGTNYNAVTNGGMYSGATTATLDLYGVGEEHNGYLYYVVITGTAPCAPVTSDVATLGVSDVGITTQPQAVVLCGSGNAEFTVVAEGTGLTYQWYVNQGSGPQAITNGTVGGITYSGATSATLNVANVSTVNNGWAYYVAVTDAALAEAISGVAILTVNTPPQVTASPANNVVCYAGGTVNYNVTATGTGISYQWQYATSASGPWTNVSDASPAGTTYSGASTASLSVTTTASTPVQTYYYKAVVIGVAPCSASAESDVATLTFFTPQITTQPVAAATTIGNSATFTVATSATSPSYQWQYATSASGPWNNVTAATPAGTTYSGDTTATLTVNANTTAAGSNYHFRAVVTSGGCSVNSNAAQLTVADYCATTFTNAATNDYVTAMTITGTTFSAAPTQVTTAPYYSFLTGGTNTTTLYSGNTYTANFTVGSAGTQGVGVWIDFNNDGDFSDTGEFIGATSITASGSGTISVVVPAGVTAGNKRMRVRNSRASTLIAGSACGNLARGNTVDFVVTITEAPICTGTPAAATVASSTPSLCNSGTATLTATGLPAYVTGIQLQWYNTAGAIAGANSATYTTATISATETYYLKVTCSGSGLSSDSNHVTVTVNSPAVTATAPGERCGTGTVTLGATGSAGTTLSWYAASTGGAALGTGTTFTTPSISTTTNYYVEANVGGANAVAGPANHLYGGTASTVASPSTSYYMIFNATSAAKISSVTVYATAAGQLNLQLANSSGGILQTYSYTVTSAEANSTTTVAGTPIVLPVNFDVPVGTGLRLGIATGTTATILRNTTGALPYYNVSANGVTFTNNWLADTTYWYFFYNIVVGSGCSSARTAVAATVSTAPALTLSSAAVTSCSGTPSAAVTVTAGAGDYNTYVWTPSTGVSGNATTGWTFNPSATTTYTLAASQSGGAHCTNSATVTVTVNGAPTALVVSPAATSVCSGEVVDLTASGGTLSGSYVLGTQTTTSNTAGITPFSSNYEGSREQYLVRASELTAMGITAGNISSLAFTVTSQGTGVTPQSNFSIKIGKTDATAIGSTAGYATLVGSFTTVFTAASVPAPAVGERLFTFSTPYVWDGTSNIIIDICHDNDTTNTCASCFSSNSGVAVMATAFNSVYGSYVDNAAACGVVATNKITNFTTRPIMKFGVDQQGAVTWAPTAGLYTNPAATVAYTGNAVSIVYAKPATTTTYTATATLGSGCTATGSATITINDKVWTGTFDTKWTTPGNWCGNTVPTATDNVVIPNTTLKPVIDGGALIAYANTVKVQTGGLLTVKRGSSLEVTGAIDITGANALVVENYAAVKQIDDVANTGTGTANVHRNSSKLFRNDYTLWSSPVQGQGIFQFSPSTLPGRFYSYNTETDSYNTVPDLSATSTTTFALGESYLIRLPDAQKIGGVPTGTFVPATLAPPGQDYNAGIQRMIYNGVYKGKPNNGTISVAVNTDGNGYNAIGNPYPSPISISQFFAENGNNTDGTIYVWRKKNATEGSAYCTITADGEYNSNLQPEAENPNGLLQTGQGFIVKALGPIVFNNNMRQTVTVVDSSFFRSPVLEAHRIRLNLYKGTKPVGQTLIAYKNNATMGVDQGVDALYINDVNTSLNSMIGSTAYAIQGRALPFSNQDIVPLQFKAGTEGNFTISLAEVDGMFAGNQNVYLRDKLLNVIHDIKGGSYSFVTQIGTFNDRFDVVYTDSALGTDNPVLDPNSIVIYKNENKLHINSGVAVMKDIRIFDIRGRLVYEKAGVNATTAEVTGLSVQEEMLIVQVTTVDNAKVSKKVIY